jgi:hypothetical protein
LIAAELRKLLVIYSLDTLGYCPNFEISSSMIESQFLFAVCQAGAEGALKREVDPGS